MKLCSYISCELVYKIILYFSLNSKLLFVITLCFKKLLTFLISVAQCNTAEIQAQTFHGSKGFPLLPEPAWSKHSVGRSRVCGVAPAVTRNVHCIICYGGFILTTSQSQWCQWLWIAHGISAVSKHHCDLNKENSLEYFVDGEQHYVQVLRSSVPSPVFLFILVTSPVFLFILF